MKSSSSNKKKITADKKSSKVSVAKTVKAKTGEPLIKSTNLFPVVGIGASAGGLDAFKKLLKAIPEDSGMAYVLVQHLDPNHESLLPEILQKVTPIPVMEITDDIKVLPNHIYVIPSNKMMVATDGVLLLAPRSEKSKTGRNLPIDLFFTSLAEVHQEHAIGVVLSGTASDGTQGLRAIKDHGGITFAQDEASAEYEGMPHSAAQAGVVDFILPPGDIPKKLIEVTRKIVRSDEELQNIPKPEEDVFRQILSLLRIRKGVDFTYYKQTTVRRRILRRMVVNKNEDPADYLKFLRGSNPEQDLLYQDMLIPVTSFFRDKKTFDNLCNTVFPTILKNKIPGEITRVWVAGCSTGQEVYSFAICFKEFLGDNHERLQIFGTDLSEPAIIKARTGIYEKSEIEALSPERLKEYFTKNNGGYQVNKNVRDMCVFAHHNFLKDPPFGKMDCISCRNVLIYMEPYLQKRALTTFHYALNPKGFLLLGKSETTGGVPDLFASAAKNDKLYTRKDVPGRFMQVTSPRSEQVLSRAVENSKSDSDSHRNRTDFQKTADDILLTKYTPAGVVVNEAMDIVHFRGNTANYLEQAPGKPSHNLLIMAKHGLAFELRNILHKVKNDKAPVVKENISMHVNGILQSISLEAIPLPYTLEPYYLILFRNNSLTDTDGLAISNRKKVSAKTKKDEKDIRIQLLDDELSQVREDMRSITEEQEASNEELQSANEELLSGSEELQSLNEELETSKEELQSTNEELTVLNHELINLNEQVTDARNYSESIVATLYQPLLVLDKHLRVKTANQAFYKTFKVNEQETEGVLIYDLGNRQWNIPELRTLLEEILPQKKQISDFEVTHNFLSIGKRIILLNALELTREKKEEKLILLSIEDITERKAAAKKIVENEKKKAFLLKISDTLEPLSNPVDIEKAVTKIALDFMDADWCHYSTIEGENLTILYSAVRGDLPSVVGEYRVSDFALFKAILDAGRPYIVDDVRTTDIFDEDLKQLCVKLQNISFINVPVIKNGKPVGLLSVVQSKPRKWTDTEVQLTIETAERTWAAVEKAKAEEALRTSEEKYRSLFNSMDEGYCTLRVLFNETGKAIDCLYLDVNPAFVSQSGLENVVGKTMLEINPETETFWFETYGRISKTGEAERSEHPVSGLGKIFEYYAFRFGDPVENVVAVIFNNITDRKNEEELQTYILKLSDAINELVNPVEIQLTACRILGEHVKASRVLYSEVINEELLIINNNYVNGVSPIIGTIHADQFGKNVIDALKRNEKVIFSDINTDDRYNEDEKQSFLSLDVVANAGMGLLKGGRWVSTLGMHYNAPRKWTATEILLMEETAERTWAAVERAKAEEALRRSEEKYRTLFTSINQGFSLSELIRNKEGKGIDFRVLEVNPTYEKQSGVSMEMVLDKTILQAFPTLDTWWIETYTAVVDNQRSVVFEKYFEDTNRWFEINAYPSEKDKFAILFSDITERKQTEEKLKESESRFRTMADASPVFIWTLDANGSSSYYNKTFLDFIGVPKDADISDWAQIVHPDDVQPTFDNINNAIAKRQPYSIELRMLRADGDWRWVLAQGNPNLDINNEFLGFVGSSVDITERKQAEEKIKESEERYHNMIYSSPSLIAIFKGEDMIIDIANDAVLESWGKGKDIIGKSILSVMPEIVEQGFGELLLGVYKTGEPYYAYETPVTLIKNGEQKLMHYTFVYQAQRNSLGEIDGVAVIANEVTTQVELNQKIIESEQYFRKLTDTLPAIIWITDPDGSCTYLNKNWYDYTGQTEAEAKGFGWLDATHPDDKEKAGRIFAAANAQQKQFSISYRLQVKNGEYRWAIDRGSPKFSAGGVFEGMIGTVVDVHEEKIAEEAVKRFKYMAENASDPFILMREDGTFSYLNSLALERWGYNEEEAKHIRVSDVDPLYNDEVFNEVFARAQIESIPPFETLHKKKDGHTFPVEVNMGGLMLQGKQYVFAVARDITERKKTEQALIDSEAFNRSILENSPDCVKIIDKDGRIQYMNNNGLCIMDIDDFVNIKNKSWTDLWGEENRQTLLNAIEKALGGEMAQFQAYRPTAKGTPKWWDVIVTPIHEPGNKIIKSIISVSRDITEQRTSQSLLEYRKALLEAHNESGVDGILLVDANGKILSYNHRFITIWNMPQEIVDAKNDDTALDFAMTQLVHPEQFIEKVKYLYEHPLETNIDLLEFKDGKIVERHGYPVMAPDGTYFAWSWTFRDVSEQKRIAKELTEAIVFAEMATVIAEEAKEKAEGATVMAEEAAKAKQQFLSNMSHEIRTPMNAIIGFTKVVLKTELTVKQREYLNAIKLSGNSLIVLINDILDLAKVEAGKMTFEEIPFKMASSLTAIMHLFEIKVQEKNLQLVKEYDDNIPEVLLGDPVRLHQIILNLVSNAVKFTSKGKITIGMRMLTADDEKVSIEFKVTDTGIGIPENNKDKIFEKFHQATSDTTRLYGGTGLGLAIVKQLVESQGGKILLKTEVNKGSTFRFVLSFKKTVADVEIETEMLKIDPANKNIKVLVVEDIALNQLLMKTLLDEFGFDREIAPNGMIAIEKLKAKAYDIILMDLQMPEMNGFEATAYIRNTLHSNIPIIALTADVTTVDLEKCKAVGMNDYIPKPVDERLLYSKIVGLVKNPPEKMYYAAHAEETEIYIKSKCTDLAYLISITRYDIKLMMEMIALYLEQTPTLISAMKKSLQDEDWDAMNAAVHKLIPSFSIMGISKEYETMAKKVQEYTRPGNSNNDREEIQDLVLQLVNICTQACSELEEEYSTLKNTKE